jgi:hypothetical protein
MRFAMIATDGYEISLATEILIRTKASALAMKGHEKERV